MSRPIRVAVRGLLLHENRLLVVNAWPGDKSKLLCAPGGGANPHSSLEDNLIREFMEETGLNIDVGEQVLVNEFHAPDRDFHQVDVYFRVTTVDPVIDPEWQDPEGVVTTRRFVSRDELEGLFFKPDSLPAVAWGDPDAPRYDPIELSVR